MILETTHGNLTISQKNGDYGGCFKKKMQDALMEWRQETMIHF